MSFLTIYLTTKYDITHKKSPSNESVGILYSQQFPYLIVFGHFCMDRDLQNNECAPCLNAA